MKVIWATQGGLVSKTNGWGCSQWYSTFLVHVGLSFITTHLCVCKKEREEKKVEGGVIRVRKKSKG